MAYRFITEHKSKLGVRWLCKKLNISPSSYYNYLKFRKHKYYIKQEKILEKIKYIYKKHKGTVGHRFMQVLLARYGIKLSKTTVHKYMNKILGLKSIIMRKKPPYKTGKKHKIFSNLLNQNFFADKKNKVWCTDFTYMKILGNKFRYNCTIIDLYDRSVVASVNGSELTSNLAIQTLKKALANEHNPKGVILHSDQGSQFASKEFTSFCKQNNVIQSMSRAGCPYDNAPMERYFNTFKSCFFNIHQFVSAHMLDLATYRFVLYYNFIRPHSFNNYFAPCLARSI